MALPDAAAHLDALIDAHDATVAVMGLGYVGLPLLDAVHGAGFDVIGLDDDPAKIAQLEAGTNYLPHLGTDLPTRLTASEGARLTSDPASLADADIILICVPTPLDDAHRPDLTYVERAAGAIRDAITGDARPRLIVLESTTHPGTTRDVLTPIVRAHDDVFVAFSPEREDPGRTSHSTRTIPKLVGGIDDASGALGARFYEQVVETVVPCASAEVAEAAKLVENVYRAVNIALVNELKIVLDAMGLDVWDVLDAASTKPFGFHRFDPGPGFGGHCVPIDPFYLAESARRAGTQARFIELAGEVNRLMPGYVVDRCETALREHGETPIAGARVLVLGLAYKRNVGDVRESPSFELITLLQQRGAEVSYHDPFVARTWRGRRHDLQMESASWSEQTLRDTDLVLVATDHDWYDFAFVGAHARLIVDTRNAMTGVESAAIVVKA
ncbi:MAG: nucleotide sugar dehydrogenase [Planctomycetota bacterium]